MIEHCYSCHSREADKVKGGFALDSREGLLKGGEGGGVVVPGKPDSSRLVQAIRHTDAEFKMPPKDPLRADQIALIEQWVVSGAAYPKSRGGAAGSSGNSLAESRKQWPFTRVQAPPEPKVRAQNWPRQGLDRFILAKLESMGLRPAPQAGGIDLLRRLSFDLTGLPPSTEAIVSFGNGAPAREKIESLVDGLLDSPRFGEKWGRHWLDIARYSDSNGLEANLEYQEAWRYRDYVIGAFNRDKPYDVFIREQLAGDLLQPESLEAQLEALTATGFLSLGPKTLNEEPEKMRLDVADEQIDVTMRGFQGLTVSCARCHDHKFDPISLRDYYALAGIFTSTASLRTGAEAAAPGPLRTPWMERPLESKEKQEAYEKHQREVAELSTRVRSAMQLKKTLPGGVSSNQLGGILVDNTQAVATGTWRSSTGSTNRFIQSDYLQDSDREKGKKSLRFQPVLPAAGRYEVRFAYPPSWNRATNVPVRVEHKSGVANLILDQRQEPPIDRLFVSLGEFEFEAGTNGAVVVSNAGTRGSVVADAVQFLSLEAAVPAMTSVKPAAGTDAQNMMATPGTDPFTMQEKLFELQDQAPPRPAMTMAVAEGRVAHTPVRLRGDVKRPGEVAPRAIPPILVPAGLQAPAIPEQESGRRQLADWLGSTQNPLTARVAVNRVWMHLFGKPLAGTPDNFGVLGERPSQPELLDHLAARFMALGWSHKKLIREIVLSSAYQQSTVAGAETLAKDPDNQWFSRMPVRRLPAESIRDAMLHASGKLDLQMGGPSLTAAPAGAVPRPAGVMGPAEAAFRRSVYLPVRRNNLDDLMQSFDFADPHALAAKRNQTSAPTQALYMLNSDLVHEQSQALSESLAALPSDSARLEQLFLRTLSRSPDADEKSRSLDFVARFKPGPVRPGETAGPAEREAWRALAHVLFATTEFRFLN
ncbi:MAG: DUF1553 domain-containing protein [Verrucomicrobia bacterium]|nr:DUF1553 domain-containing protein [Verrucomicrobiota bacterium]